MWGIFVGIGIGIVQLILLQKAINILLDVKNAKSSATWIFLVKFGIILLTLFLMANFFGVYTMLYCAGGLVGVIVLVPMYKGIKTIIAYKKMKNSKIEVE